jgi:amidohydrolase
VLGAERASLRGTIKLIFQPAEEGYGGAREMIAAGVLEGDRGLGPRVDSIFGAHLWSYEALGVVGARKGAMMAGSDKFEIVVRGKGGHGAAPHSTVDAVVVAASLVTALQTVVSRSVDPLEPAVLTCGTIKGGYGYNIIADEVLVGGTTRCFSPAVQGLIKERMRCICEGVGGAFGAGVALNYMHGYPPTVNEDEASLGFVWEAAAAVVGEARVKHDVITCGAEDFSYFLQQRPGTFFFVGAALPGELRPHHKSVFDFDEECLPIVASVFVHIVRGFTARAGK